MNSKTTLAAAAITGLFAVTTFAASTGAAQPGVKISTLADKGTHSCKGQNACKGQGGCKGSDASCKGKNSCKGKGGCATDGSHK